MHAIGYVAEEKKKKENEEERKMKKSKKIFCLTLDQQDCSTSTYSFYDSDDNEHNSHDNTATGADYHWCH